MNQWVDFKTLRQSLSFEAVLRLYNVEPKIRGSQHHGFCPLPNHNGKKNSPSFSANITKGIFKCFGCGAHGNVLDFAVLMDGGLPHNPAAVRKTALTLQEKLGLQVTAKPRLPKLESMAQRKQDGGTTLVNVPLDFELKTLDSKHPYLRGRGLTEQTIEKFGLGFCAKGYLQGRIAIPLRDTLGRLIGYAGRIVDDTRINEDNPKYKFPGWRERKGTNYEFRKSEFLYGGYLIKEPVDDLVVVEGFPSVWWLEQNTIPNAVALMGWSCSEDQAKLIIAHTKSNGRVWLLSDGDDAGVQCAQNVLPPVSRERFVRWLKLSDGKQPTDHTGEELREFLTL